MLISVLKKKDDTNILLLGLSKKNLVGLRDVGPISVNLGELGFKGALYITTLQDGKVLLPEDEYSPALCLIEDTIEALGKGLFLRLHLEHEYYTGEVILFSAADERAMEEMFSHLIPPGQGSTTCPTCRTGFRQDGTCDCRDSLQ